MYVKLGYLLIVLFYFLKYGFIWSQPVKDENPETVLRELSKDTLILLLFKSTNVQHLLKQSYYISTFRVLTSLGKHTKTIFHHSAAGKHYVNLLGGKKAEKNKQGIFRTSDQEHTAEIFPSFSADVPG